MSDTTSERITVESLNPTERARLANTLTGYLSGLEWPANPAEQAAVGRDFVPAFEATLPHLAQVLQDVKSGKLLAAYFTGLPQEPSEARIVLLAMSSMLGATFNYSSQNSGELVMRLVPITGSAGNTNATRGEFKIHTDDAALPRDARTEYINLYGIVNPPGTLTSYAAASDALSELDPSVIDVLREARFSLRFPTSFGFGAEMWSAPCPILVGAEDDIELRFPSYATRPSREGDEVALAAIERLAKALDRHAVGFPLDPGCFLTFNNYRGAHKRGAIGESERLIFRTYSTRTLDFLRDVTGSHGPIFPIDSFAKKISA
ncbi:TauD/TfdA family dioxygenase [Bradyrhizobium icense]|uniref:Uncharacterized protein n=1 Tax=Bradyrhizobium icense TaxID=1274631 RepID=A0A1B1UJK6_9BRAD|nr:TauD/TfdA family dioxygenase [Bradyrhizobium icense]ANW02972.1 hypothetical protein LMTR13_25260 [Bradyrhizobium icense]